MKTHKCRVIPKVWPQPKKNLFWDHYQNLFWNCCLKWRSLTFYKNGLKSCGAMLFEKKLDWTLNCDFKWHCKELCVPKIAQICRTGLDQFKGPWNWPWNWADKNGLTMWPDKNVGPWIGPWWWAGTQKNCGILKGSEKPEILVIKRLTATRHKKEFPNYQIKGSLLKIACSSRIKPSFNWGWWNRVHVPSELRGTLVRTKAIAKAYIDRVRLKTSR